MTGLSRELGGEAGPDDVREHYYGFEFKISDLEKLAQHPLFSPSNHEMEDDPDLALEGSRENATAAIVRATRSACGPYPTQEQIDEATQVVLGYLDSLPDEEFEVDGDEPGFFNPGDVADEIRDVVEGHFKGKGKDNIPAPSEP